MSRVLLSPLLRHVASQNQRVMPSSSSVTALLVGFPTQRQPERSLSYVLDGWGQSGSGGSSTWSWPVTKTNTIINIVPQGHKYVVERFGKLHEIHDSGLFFAVPFVDSIAYVVDVRERAMDIAPQTAITRDNVSVEVSGNLFIKIQDAQNAAYGALNPLYSVTQVRQLLFSDFEKRSLVSKTVSLS